MSSVTFAESQDVLKSDELDDCLAGKVEESEYMSFIGHMTWLYWTNEFFDKKFGFRLYGPPKRDTTAIFEVSSHQSVLRREKFPPRVIVHLLIFENS